MKLKISLLLLPPVVEGVADQFADVRTTLGDASLVAWAHQREEEMELIATMLDTGQDVDAVIAKAKGSMILNLLMPMLPMMGASVEAAIIRPGAEPVPVVLH